VQAKSSLQLDVLAKAYKAVTDKLPATTFCWRSGTLRNARTLARNNNPWLNIAQAELLALPALSLENAQRLTSDLLRDPLCVEKNQAAVLAAFAKRLDAEADPKLKPSPPWGNDIWAFVTWATTKAGFNPDRTPPLD
jgi:hypothetical protein